MKIVRSSLSISVYERKWYFKIFNENNRNTAFVRDRVYIQTLGEYNDLNYLKNMEEK